MMHNPTTKHTAKNLKVEKDYSGPSSMISQIFLSIYSLPANFEYATDGKATLTTSHPSKPNFKLLVPNGYFAPKIYVLNIFNIRLK